MSENYVKRHVFMTAFDTAISLEEPYDKMKTPIVDISLTMDGK